MNLNFEKYTVRYKIREMFVIQWVRSSSQDVYSNHNSKSKMYTSLTNLSLIYKGFPFPSQVSLFLTVHNQGCRFFHV